MNLFDIDEEKYVIESNFVVFSRQRTRWADILSIEVFHIKKSD